ncbi:DUF262 domain-containing protein [Parashewanella tropica]|uniref:DUF262 domain-containing protein n=1 Tax=Parashewanella tropica TaxID=2547970 RepID=UPI00105929A5|nr:DUF262 domain-containing protein [Parashewanella tropica]
MSIIHKDVQSVKSLLSEPLSIPSYQRPYKWQGKHVSQLLDDVILHRSKSRYRLGTVVLHQDDKKQQKSIVDGQQRLLTLTLLCSLLDKARQFRPPLLEQTFSSKVTRENLQHNAAVIESRIKQLGEADREELIDFILHKCELIVVRLDSLSEAFQFFDSQNARGKELEPFDLLKAFHLREMEHNTEDERTLCVQNWEDSVSPDHTRKQSLPSLHTIMSDYLFRLRCWADGKPGQLFSRHNIDVFKGVNLNQKSYPFASAMRALDVQVDQYNLDSVRRWDQQIMGYPFQVDQTMLNGKRFFEYIQHYIHIYKTLFIDDKPELRQLMNIINHYKGRSRKGDHYVRNLFFCAVMHYYDRFGDDELEKAARLCFVWSYRIRLEQNRVVIESIDNQARARNELLHVIRQALQPQQVLAFPMVPVHRDSIKGTNLGNHNPEVNGLVEQFEEMGYIQ